MIAAAYQSLALGLLRAECDLATLVFRHEPEPIGAQTAPSH